MGSLCWADALPLSLHSSRAPDRRGNVKGSPCRDNPSTLMQDVGPATRRAHEIRDTGRQRNTTLGAYCSQCYLHCFGVLPSWALSEWISSECCICTGQLELAQRWATQQPRLSCYPHMHQLRSAPCSDHALMALCARVCSSGRHFAIQRCMLWPDAHSWTARRSVLVAYSHCESAPAITEF